MAKLTDYLTTAQAAERIGVTPGRVRQIAFPGSIRIGKIRLIPSTEADKVAKSPAKTGRPRNKLPQKTRRKPAISGIPAK